MVDRAFSSLVSKANPSVPGCPAPTVEQYIRDSAIRTCERTLMWRYQPPLYNLLPGVYEYNYEKPVNTDVHAMFAALVNDTPLTVLTLEQAIKKYPAWADLYSGESAATLWSLTDSGGYDTQDYNEDLFNDGATFTLPASVIADGGTPLSVTQITPDKYVVLPLPDGDTYSMRMFTALKPKRDATGMSEAIFDDLEEVILHGALQHLLVLPNQYWSDRELAAYHTKQYTYQIAERRARANLGSARGTLVAKFPSFGA